ncbi:hypothetical protein LCGC14_0232330 [marine sediment metagenome]|uniref:Uncharacterized protein n=1 Tax=marine sediment metagenome TaxID=412755 RepID=A0A0F9URH3_9ZZZZ
MSSKLHEVWVSRPLTDDATIASGKDRPYVLIESSQHHDPIQKRKMQRWSVFDSEQSLFQHFPTSAGAIIEVVEGLKYYAIVHDSEAKAVLFTEDVDSHKTVRNPPEFPTRHEAAMYLLLSSKF